MAARSSEHTGWGRHSNGLLRTGLWGMTRGSDGVASFLGLQGHGRRDGERRICLADASAAGSHVRKETPVPAQAPPPHSQLGQQR